MTTEEFKQMREKIEMQYRDDMAAIERAWTLLNGTRPPEGLVDFQPPEERGGGINHEGRMRSAAELGIMTSGAMDSTHRGAHKQKHGTMTDEEKKERKREYMRRYMAKRVKEGKPIAKKKFDALLLRKPVEANVVHE